MTISSETNKSGPYTCNGSTDTFAYTFRILDDDHIAVEVKNTSTGAITTLVKTTDYTVTGVGESSGGNVVLVDAATDAPSGTVLTVVRNVTKTQETDYNEYDTFPAQSHEDALDKLTMISQEQQEEIDRTIKVDSAVTGVSTSLPTPVASRLIGWDSAGTALSNYTTSDLSGEWTISGSAGIWAAIDADDVTLRTLTGTSNEITVTNGDGVSGNPTFSLPTALTFTGKTITGGTYVTPNIGVATATSINKVTITEPASAATITVLNNKALAVNNTVTFTGTDGSSVNFKTGGNIAYDSAASDAWTSFTPGFTGFSSDPGSVTAYYKKIGNTCVVSIYMGSAGTSNATSFTITGLPFNAKRTAFIALPHAIDNGAGSFICTGSLAASSTTLTLYKNQGASNWTASGSKYAHGTFTYETE